MAYRLKKKYPTLPVDWEVGMLVELDNKTYYSLVDKKYRQHYLYIYDVENNPEYWEEVVEKDYEILSILLRKSTEHEKRIVDNNDSEDYIISLINCDGNSIYSVKRLSDNEIFTVGDNTNSGVITKIQWDKERGLWLDFPGHGGYGDYTNLKKVVKVSLGKTQDTNEPVYENDKVFLLTCNWTCPEVIMTKKEYFKTPPMLFKTKENAQEYIVNNKPCLSYNEVLKEVGFVNIPTLQKYVTEKLKISNGS